MVPFLNTFSVTIDFTFTTKEIFYTKYLLSVCSFFKAK